MKRKDRQHLLVACIHSTAATSGSAVYLLWSISSSFISCHAAVDWLCCLFSPPPPQPPQVWFLISVASILNCDCVFSFCTPYLIIVYSISQWFVSAGLCFVNPGRIWAWCATCIESIFKSRSWPGIQMAASISTAIIAIPWCLPQVDTCRSIVWGIVFFLKLIIFFAQQKRANTRNSLLSR